MTKSRKRRIARIIKESHRALSRLTLDNVEMIYGGTNSWKAIDKAIDIIEKQERQRAFECVAPVVDQLVERMFDETPGGCIIHCTYDDSVGCGSECCVEDNKKYWQDEIKRRLGLEV